MDSKWRETAQPIIKKVIENNGKEDNKKLRKALREAYPFGGRELHPYKIWCDEIKSQLGIKKLKQKKLDENQPSIF